MIMPTDRPAIPETRDKIAMRQELRTDPAESGTHPAQVVGQRLNQRRNRCPIDIERRQPIANKKAAAGFSLGFELHVQCLQYFSNPLRGASADAAE